MSKNLNLLISVLKFYPEKRLYLPLPLSLLILSNIISLLIPILSIRIIDMLRGAGDLDIPNTILLMSVWLFALCLVLCLDYFQVQYLKRYGIKVSLSVYGILVSRQFHLDYENWIDQNAKKTSDLIKRNMEDLMPLISGVPFMLIRHLCIMIIGSILLVSINWRLSVAVGVLLPFYVIAYVLFDKDIIEKYWIFRKTCQEHICRFTEYLQSIPMLRIFCSANKSIEKLVHVFEETLETEFAYFKTIFKRKTYTRMITQLTPVYLAFLAFIFIDNNLATIGEIFGFWGLFSLVISASNSLSVQYTGILKALSVFSKLKNNIVENRNNNGKIIINEIVNISWTDMKYFYRRNKVQDIKFPAFSIDKGDHIWIKGKSGVGKTTLLRLIFGLTQPGAGELTVNGILRKNVQDESFFSHIGYVEQNGIIFSANICENILLGRIYNDACLNQAVYLAGLENLIQSLENGHQQKIGENGFCLSGGEKQRILIARALYHKPQWLILDEPFTGLDIKTQYDIGRLLNSIGDKISIILVSHNSRHYFRANKTISLI